MPDGAHREIWNRINENRDKINDNQKAIIAINGKLDHLTEKAEDSNTKLIGLDNKFGQLKNELLNNKIDDVKRNVGLQIGYWLIRIIFVALVSGAITIGVTFLSRLWK